ncbi:magnesium/cobalt transporter CorA [Nocardioides sp. MAH-18]|uniref:Magnesium transport protein CorA n=1 Tax=Nocardioides agri TaxID=2682843 RepID=A0A6L6XXE3_9ACTN|nr:magnesium/cobalt transporter CorA [Nocardioides sp. CGMCC 1.13656]MBA2952768.1 magnesium/cobalt transporter CorA [Nocardioides sp. CGMCC 1.13656]MVQ51930.1 magnesium/cobalt transporter CorA [Nocardioides sp. MAH-18]
MIVDSALYRAGARVQGDDDLAALRARACEPGDFVWVGVHEPSENEFQRLAEIFGLHPLAVEDAVRAHQRPKLERFGDSVFLVLKTLWYVDEADAVETGEIALFLGRDFVVSVRHGAGNELHTARLELEASRKLLGHGPGGVLYAVLDRVVDEYLQVVDELVVDVDEVEASVFSAERTNDASRIYVLKRELGEVRRAVMPLREPVARLAAGTVTGVPDGAAPFFRDVSDHLARAAETVDGLDSLLSSAFDAHLAQISVQQNDDMRKISAGAALIVVPTFIAGVYGMNFHHMPELGWTFGYPFALLLMATVAGGLWVWFKKSGWL